MPIYAYRCAACGHAKDVLQKLSDAPLADCPACGEPRFEKQVTAAGFQLKGSGWYATDFRNGQSNKPATQADGPTDAKPASDGAAATAPAAGASAAPAASPAPAPATAAPPASSTS
jgi:putative FmdB family regulatory protein